MMIILTSVFKMVVMIVVMVMMTLVLVFSKGVDVDGSSDDHI